MPRTTHGDISLAPHSAMVRMRLAATGGLPHSAAGGMHMPQTTQGHLPHSAAGGMPQAIQGVARAAFCVLQQQGRHGLYISQRETYLLLQAGAEGGKVPWALGAQKVCRL